MKMNKQKSTKQRMAEWIMENNPNSICYICANRERCHGSDPNEPNEQECVNGIINYFERLKYADNDKV